MERPVLNNRITRLLKNLNVDYQ